MANQEDQAFGAGPASAAHLQALYEVVRSLNSIRLQLATFLPQVLAAQAYTFAALTAAVPTPARGQMATVTDSNTTTWGATIAGGSTNVVLAFYDGANWTVAGK